MTKDERRLLMHWYAGQALASLSMDGTIYHVARTAADLAEAMLEEVEACRKMHEEGFNAKYISNQTGIALDTVRDWIYYRTRHYA
jgi:hypothetical protein